MLSFTSPLATASPVSCDTAWEINPHPAAPNGTKARSLSPDLVHTIQSCFRLNWSHEKKAHGPWRRRNSRLHLLWILCFVERASLHNLVNRTNLVHDFLNVFIYFLYIFRATMCPSSGENTVLVRHLVFVTLKQVDILKLQGLMS